MALQQIIPQVFYEDIQIGLRFFVEGLGFKLEYHDEVLYIVKRDQISIMLVADPEFAKGDRPQIRIQTDDIDAIYNEIKARSAEVLHPNLKHIKDQPWGLREFAALDSTTVCIVFQQALL